MQKSARIYLTLAGFKARNTEMQLYEEFLVYRTVKRQTFEI